MVLLVPKALAKQIMCINTRRIEERRGVSGKDRGAETTENKSVGKCGTAVFLLRIVIH